MKKEKSGKRLLIVLLLLTVLWMAVIFLFSARNAEQSTVESTGVTEKILSASDSEFGTLDEHSQKVMVSQLENYVRKWAHVFNFVVLGIISSVFVLCLGKKRIVNVSASFVFCVLYAASDEFHQLFVPGRGASVKDVLIDSAGALIGTVVVAAVTAVIRLSKK